MKTSTEFAKLVQNLNRDELVLLNRMVIRHIKMLDADAVDQFNTGQRVHFTSNRDGVTRNGTVTKVGRKTIVIKTDLLTYKVPGSMVVSGWNKTVKAA